MLAAAAAASPALLASCAKSSPPPSGPGSVYARPLHIVYANSGGLALSYDEATLLQAFAQVTTGLTAVTPFFLNVATPTRYQSIIDKLQAQQITIIPGVGGDPSQGPLNSPAYQAMAQAHRAYTSYIRLENAQGFVDTYGATDVQGMVTYLTGTLGYAHVMLNPWPKDASGAALAFAGGAVEASFNQVQCNFDHTSYQLQPDPTNWLVNLVAVNRILAAKPSCAILVNYESAPEHQVLVALERAQSGSSIPALQVTATQCLNSNGTLHWCPPFTKIYDSIQLGTWNWIASQLSKAT
jgi:hypothetical protein